MSYSRVHGACGTYGGATSGPTVSKHTVSFQMRVLPDTNIMRFVCRTFVFCDAWGLDAMTLC